jgi:hypothetical protein
VAVDDDDDEQQAGLPRSVARARQQAMANALQDSPPRHHLEIEPELGADSVTRISVLPVITHPETLHLNSENSIERQSRAIAESILNDPVAFEESFLEIFG